MKDKEVPTEFEQLRAQLSELQKSREEDSQSAANVENDPVSDVISKTVEEYDSLTSTDTTNADTLQKDDLMSQVQELINALDEDIKQSKPATLLVIFALGVLVGRLLPR